MSSEVETSLTVPAAIRQHGQTIVRDSSTSVGMTKRLFSSLAVYHDESTRTAALNMAIDEALLETATAPSIRFYQWDHPALSFGYFGRFEDVAHYQRDIVRRWTGGGIVLHGEDLTYSIVIPANDAAFQESSMSIYENVHRALGSALGTSGQPAQLAHDSMFNLRPSTFNAQCFANPVKSDVILDGRKVAGAAQRRTRRGLLHQGSIQNVNFGNDFTKLFAKTLCHDCRQAQLEQALISRAEEISQHKYRSPAWIHRR